MDEIKKFLKLGAYCLLLMAFLGVLRLKMDSLNGMTLNNATLAASFYHNDNVVSQAALTANAQSAIDKVSPSVVSLYGYEDVSGQEATELTLPFLRVSVPVPMHTQMQVDAGTGFFVGSDGYILTSKHVVSDQSAYFIAELSDGTEKPAQVVYLDPEYDIAVLKVSGSGYAALPLGDSSKLRRGQTVIGMGNAFGQYKNLTSIGSIDALHQDIVSSDEQGNEHQLSDLFQSSMQLYPGDSGGPTFDTSGTVVGINDAIAVDQGNISFSVPINYAKNALAKAMAQQ